MEFINPKDLDACDPHPSPEELLLFREQYISIVRAINELPDHMRAIVRLILIDSEPVKKVAKMFKMRPKAVTKLVADAAELIATKALHE